MSAMFAPYTLAESSMTEVRAESETLTEVHCKAMAVSVFASCNLKQPFSEKSNYLLFFDLRQLQNSKNNASFPYKFKL